MTENICISKTKHTQVGHKWPIQGLFVPSDVMQDKVKLHSMRLSWPGSHLPANPSPITP